MKIEKITVTNFLGLRHLALDVDAPVLLAVGPNGSGKSSLIEAIRFALAGETPRAALKKDFPALLSSGQTAGSVTLHVDGAEVSRNVKTGSATGAPADLGALAYTLDAPRLAHMDAKERRAALFGLMGVSFSVSSIVPQLIERGHAAEHVEWITPALRAGFDAAATEARKLAAEARGGWKVVTGETYGAVKAETWSPQPQLSVPVVDPGLDYEKLRDAYDAAVALAAAMEERKAAAERAAINTQRLRDRAAKIGVLREDLANLEAVQAAQAPKQTPVGDCPKCGAALAKEGSALVLLTPAAEVDPRITDAALATSLSATRRELLDAENAQAALEEAEDMRPLDVPTDGEIMAAKRAAGEAREIVDKAEVLLRAADEAKRATAADAKRGERAQALHGLVVAWSALEAALSPSGLPAELLARALGPLNADLERVHQASEWPLVQVADDISITAGGRPYGLLSESEKWRADAALAYAAASVSGCGLVLLDRFDVLDIPSRSQFLNLAQDMGEAGIQTVAAGTLKAAPEDVQGVRQSVWMGGQP